MVKQNIPKLSLTQFFYKKELDVLTRVLPSVPLTQLKFLLEISGVLMWCPISSLKSACIYSSDVQRLQIDQYDEEDLESLAEEANAFYKCSQFSPQAVLHYVMSQQYITSQQ